MGTFSTKRRRGMERERTREQLLKELAQMQRQVDGLEVECRRARELARQCADVLKERDRDLDDLAHYIVSEFRSPLGLIVGYAELLEEDGAALSEEQVRHSVGVIRQSAHKLSEMAGVLLLLANSRRLFDNVWHAAYLAALGEVSLEQWACEVGVGVQEAYRFTCLPVVSTPLVVRIWWSGGPKPYYQAVAKLGSAQMNGGNGSDSDSTEARWMLSPEAWEDLLASVQESKFWSASSALEQLGWLRMVGTEGEEWIFEGWRAGQYKARTVWGPDEQRAHAAYTLGRSFLKILPDRFTLEVARLWAIDTWPEIRPGRGQGIDVSALL